MFLFSPYIHIKGKTKADWVDYVHALAYGLFYDHRGFEGYRGAIKVATGVRNTCTYIDIVYISSRYTNIEILLANSSHF